MKEYNKKNIQVAKMLRKNMTPWERKLWYDFLRNYPVRIQRQKAIDNYIVDFYCAKARLAIELDGGEHYSNNNKEKDEKRTEELNKQKIKVLRICNLDVTNNFYGVCEYIDRIINEELNKTPSSDGQHMRPPPVADKGSICWRSGRFCAALQAA